MSSPNEHLQRAESLIEQLEATWAETHVGSTEWTTADTARLTELHLLAANTRANIRAAYTLQNIAALLAGNPDDPTGGSPWTPPTNVQPLPIRTNKPTE